MAFNISTIFRAVDVITSPLRRIIGRASQILARFSSSVSSTFSRVGSTINNIAIKPMGLIAKAGSAASLAVGGIGFAALKAFSVFEDAEASFTPMMRGAEKAKKLVDALIQTGSTTPFQFSELATIAPILLPQMGGDIDQTIKKIRQIGDIGGGDFQKTLTIATAFSRMKENQFAGLEEFNMIAQAGIPIFSELSQLVSEPDIRALKDGLKDIPFATVAKLFDIMTSKGGMFFEGMTLRSQTLSGKISSLFDSINISLGELGRALSPFARELIMRADNFVQGLTQKILENREEITQVFEVAFETVKNFAIDAFEKMKQLFTLVQQNKPEIMQFASDLRSVSEGIASLIRTGAFVAQTLGGGISSLKDRYFAPVKDGPFAQKVGQQNALEQKKDFYEIRIKDDTGRAEISGVTSPQIKTNGGLIMIEKSGGFRDLM